MQKLQEINVVHEPEIILPHEWPAHEAAKAIARPAVHRDIFVMCFEAFGVRMFIVFTM